MTKKDLQAIYKKYLDNIDKKQKHSKKEDLLLLRLCIAKLLKESEV